MFKDTMKRVVRFGVMACAVAMAVCGCSKKEDASCEKEASCEKDASCEKAVVDLLTKDVEGHKDMKDIVKVEKVTDCKLTEGDGKFKGTATVWLRHRNQVPGVGESTPFVYEVEYSRTDDGESIVSNPSGADAFRLVAFLVNGDPDGSVHPEPEDDDADADDPDDPLCDLDDDDEDDDEEDDDDEDDDEDEDDL